MYLTAPPNTGRKIGNSRLRRFLRAELLLLLVGCAAAIWLLNARVEFIGRTEPHTLVRCRMTFSPELEAFDEVRWEWKDKTSTFETYCLQPRSVSKSGRWFLKQVFRNDNYYAWRHPSWIHHPIFLNTTLLAKAPDVIRLVRGYPESRRADASGKTVTKHFRIDGCPATRTEGEYNTRGELYRFNVLWVVAGGGTVLYAVCFDAPAAGAERLIPEFEAIVASFHVEKAPLSSVEK